MPICPWAANHQVHVDYHDKEWGVPVRDEKHLFEMLTLEGAQAGLSWLTILKRRQGYTDAFYNWDVDRIARMTKDEEQALLLSANIIKNKLKVASTVTNAQVTTRIRDTHGGLSNFLWSYVNGEPIVNTFEEQAQVPATTPLSDQISKDLKKLGYKFVGSTIIYAYMQGIGMVNDHLTSCPRWQAVQG